MTPHNAVGWSAWEEENLLPWLESNRDLTWKALSIAYWQQYHVRRSVESLRGKKHHILRKRRDAGKTLIVNESEASKCANCKISKKRKRLRRSTNQWLRNPPHINQTAVTTKSKRSFTSKMPVEIALNFYQADPYHRSDTDASRLHTA
ncbi:hypothetical protein N7478_010037 [Penicillium angulare]|uniref:uncharacterized protein n=1 Tax=Penicillium angulare TaxID=116970 RepID=UPI002540DBDC|nr:uncharacterized protein N7478_010037 [Penicillium angulare]KAJ5267229.1 hypothetical protein N7478_010037 [Penicillium angulare]